jgi:hypothetical protein
MGPLINSDDTSALPLEIQFDHSWENAFGAVLGNIAKRLSIMSNNLQSPINNYAVN